MGSSTLLPAYYLTDSGHREGYVVIFAIFAVFLTILLLVVRLFMTWHTEMSMARGVAGEVCACVSHRAVVL